MEFRAKNRGVVETDAREPLAVAKSPETPVRKEPVVQLRRSLRKNKGVPGVHSTHDLIHELEDNGL